MIVIPLVQKIAELFIILFVTAALVRFNVLKPEDGKIFSKLSLYFVTPCVVFNSFQKELTPELFRGLAVTFLLAFLFEAVFMLIARIWQKIGKANEVERASVIFTNAGNLIIPIVVYILGSEWTIYCSGYIFAFNVIFWTYGIRLFDREGGINLKKLLLNPNILAMICGMLTLLLRIRLPGPLAMAFSDVASMIGPLSMMITGIIVGSMSPGDFLHNSRILQVLFMRMILCSGIAVLIAVFSGIQRMFPNGHEIVMISLMAAVAPTAANVNQVAILYNHDAKYASLISVATTLSCIVTIPFWIYVYELLSGIFL